MRRILLALAAAFLLAACNQGGGDQEQGTAPAEAAPNDADVTFTQNMIPPPRAGHRDGQAGRQPHRPARATQARR
jgi:ABC-type glycerol-3-phosphate transport system substrate-binding protein